VFGDVLFSVAAIHLSSPTFSTSLPSPCHNISLPALKIEHMSFASDSPYPSPIYPGKNSRSYATSWRNTISYTSIFFLHWDLVACLACLTIASTSH